MAFHSAWDDYWYESASQSPSASGIKVTPTTAMRATAVYACIRVLSDSVAQIPFPLYRRVKGAQKERATKHQLYKILHDQANPRMTSFNFRKLMMAWLASRGNAYAFKDLDMLDRLRGLWPIHPSAVTPKLRDDGLVEYDVIERKGIRKTYPASKILHLKGLSDDGIEGLSTIQLFQETIGLSLASELSAAQFYGNGARPGIVFESVKKVNDEDKRRFIAEWTQEYSRGGAGRPAILDQEMKLHDFSISQQDAQYIETRQLQIEEIARIFGVPPTMIGANDKQTSWGKGVEAQQIGYLVTTLNPYLKNWSAEVNVSLLDEDEREEFFAEFLTDGFVQADIKARNEALQIQRQNGIINADEWRALVNMNPIGGVEGQMRWRPANFVPADTPAPDPNPPVSIKPVKASADVPLELLGTRGALNGNGNHYDQ